MDILRSWVIATVVFIGLSLLLEASVGRHSWTAPLYLIPPALAAACACAYHAEHGTGGWLRHLAAVFPLPVLLQSRHVILNGVPEVTAEWVDAGQEVGIAGGTAAVGFLIVMTTRALMLSRRQHSVSASEGGIRTHATRY
ncbi:hypothetical protein [Nesterenkonia alba]|uniref:hypothetical protein n=1 Tax=Nesterenkonia alba TaxID=515814 RepID=UPI0003B329BF|nr:hypothetical protein [Nesterenkonia alba]